MSTEESLASFVARPALAVAPDLLGWTLRHGEVAVRLTEVEAYEGSLDPGSHAFRGRTPRTAVMFGPPGRLYVYFTYGMHYCANVVCGEEGVASAVLLRAGEVVAGHDVVRDRRAGIRERDWARGPARLTRALGIDGGFNGALLLPGCDITLEPGEPPQRIASGPRVGVSGPGGDGTAFPWRFWADGAPSVSPYRAAVARTRR